VQARAALNAAITTCVEGALKSLVESVSTVTSPCIGEFRCVICLTLFTDLCVYVLRQLEESRAVLSKYLKDHAATLCSGYEPTLAALREQVPDDCRTQMESSAGVASTGRSNVSMRCAQISKVQLNQIHEEVLSSHSGEISVVANS